MANRKFSEIKVGIFVFVAFNIVLFTLFWAKGFLINKDQHTMTAYFTSVNGLNVADPVVVNGIRKGKIKDFELETDTVRVTFTLDKDVKIRTDYTLQITAPELMGTKQLFIYSGKAPTEIDYTKPMYGETPADMAAVMKTMVDLSSDVSSLLKKFSGTTDKLDKTLTNVNDIIGDGKMKSDLKSTMSNLAVTSQNLNGMVSENRKSFKTLTDKAGNTFDNVNNLIDDTKPELSGTLKTMSALTARVDSLINSVNLFVTDVKGQKNALGKFMYDENFYKNLNNTLLEIEKLTIKIRKEGVKINIF